MQTFLPSPKFIESAQMLDNKRLGKQRVENLQIMQALLMGRGFVHHPATRMWAGYEWALLLYQEAICLEWVDRGFRDTCLASTQALYFKHRDSGEEYAPKWLGWKDFHKSHQSNLIRKDPEHYGPLFPGVPNNLPYIWPASK